MSYSRWGGSRFYTFWRSTKSKVKDDQIFDIMFDMGRELTFTYRELSYNMDGCLNKCEELCSKPYTWHMRKDFFPPYEETEEVIEPPRPFEIGDREELKLYMLQFIEDVNAQNLSK